jgi:cytoskeleton protein RodZ
MRQKIDIADVETATKIRAKYLRALENEEFGLLPGNTFVKTFLRTYAEYLGLDPQLLLEEYRAGYEPRGEELQPYSVAARRRQRDRGRQPRTRRTAGPPGPGTAIIVLVGVVLVIFAILGLTGNGGSSDSSSPKSSGGGKQQAKKKKGEGKKKSEKPAVTEVKLRAVPTVLTYMCVDRGPGETPIYNSSTTDPQAFRGKRVRINAGNASVKLSVNGKRVDVPAGSDPIGYDFQLRDGKVVTDELAVGERPCA